MRSGKTQLNRFEKTCLMFVCAVGMAVPLVPSLSMAHAPQQGLEIGLIIVQFGSVVALLRSRMKTCPARVRARF